MGSEQSKPEDETHEDKLREIARMDQAVRSKVRGGVQYNMKVIVRGERGSGKSTLWRRFQGMQFSDKYDATPEIQSATINWSFRSGEDSVKVDVWDVVDKALKPRSLPKLENGQYGRHNFDFLDASIVDVYKDTHAALFLVNPRSASSLAYVREHAKQVPPSVCILIIYNFRDVVEFHPDQCVVSYDQVVSLTDDVKAFRRETFLAESRLQGPESDDILPPVDTYAVSMALPNCFGLLELNQFLDIPFLHLKQRALREQLMKAHRDLGDAQNVLHEALGAMNYAPFAAREAEEQRQRLFEQQQVVEQGRNPAAAEAEEEERSEKLTTSLQRRTEEAREEDLRQQSRLKQQGALKLTHSSSRDDDSSDSDGYAFRKKSTKASKPAKEVEKQHDQRNGKPKESKSHKNPVPPPAPPSSQSVFEQEVASFTPAEMGLEGFLQPSDDDERLLRHQKDKIRAYVLPPGQSRDKSKNMHSSSLGDSESDDDDDVVDNRRFQAKSAMAGRLARRPAGLPSPKPSSSAPLNGSAKSTLSAFLDSSDDEGGHMVSLQSQSRHPTGPSIINSSSSSATVSTLMQTQQVMDLTGLSEEVDNIPSVGEKTRKKSDKKSRDKEKEGSKDKRPETTDSREKDKKEKEKDRKKDKDKKEKSAKKSPQFQHSSDEDGNYLGSAGGSLRRKASAAISSIPHEVEL